jgi:hypothetical protein
MTLDELRAWILAELGIAVSVATVWKTLRRLELTPKKSLIAAEQARPDIAAARERWSALKPMLDVKRLVFVDETPGSRPGAGSARLIEATPAGKVLADKARYLSQHLCACLTSNLGCKSLPSSSGGARLPRCPSTLPRPRSTVTPETGGWVRKFTHEGDAHDHLRHPRSSVWRQLRRRRSLLCLFDQGLLARSAVSLSRPVCGSFLHSYPLLVAWRSGSGHGSHRHTTRRRYKYLLASSNSISATQASRPMAWFSACRASS